MFQKDIAFYLGEELEEGFTGFLAEENFFLILTVGEGLTSEKGHIVLKSIKETILNSPAKNLSEFESLINEAIKNNNIPMNFSLAAGFVKDNVFYLKTAGLGEIFLYRGKQLAKIIQEEKIASGRIHEKDLFIFTTADFNFEKKFVQQLANRKPHEIVDEITPSLKSQDDRGLISLFVQFLETQLYTTEAAEVVPRTKNKTLTAAAVSIIFLILLWSVGLGYQRRSESAAQKKIAASRAIINQELAQAEEVAFLNLPRALTLISSAKDEVNKLKKAVGERKEVKELAKQVADKENSILKKEEKPYEEFFDLTVDNKKAKGDSIFLEGDTASILDSAQGAIYEFSLTKKSLDKKSFSEIKQAKKVVSYQGDIIFYTESGFYKISQDKINKAIDKDNDWGNIIDIWDYNGNIYALDKGKDEIYKYLAADDTYASKSSYFKSGQAVSLAAANSLAIDASVYIGFSNYIIKFTAGERDEFKTSFPESDIALTKIFTSKDAEKVYAWDKNKGALYVLRKNGTHESEIDSDILKKANDFVVYQNAAYILVGPKIYKVNLE